jgi:hypothetical protein
MHLRAALPRHVALAAALLLTSLAIPGCRSPEERAADQMESLMRTNTRMMKQMQKSMEEADRDMQRDD